MIFINSPFTILDEAFRGLYPDKKYKACIEPIKPILFNTEMARAILDGRKKMCRSYRQYI